MADNPDPTPTPQPSISLLWPFIVGSIFLFLILGIVAFWDDPTPTQFIIYRIIIALGGAGFAVALTGHLQIQFPIFQKGYIKAAAAFAVFVILFFFTPASLTVDDGEIESKRLIDQYNFGNTEIVRARQSLSANWALTTDGIIKLYNSENQPTEESLEAARTHIRKSLKADGAAEAFKIIVAAHLEVMQCASNGECNKKVLCAKMFHEMEGFRNLFCEQIIDAGNALNNNLWETYKDFAHNTCQSDFLSYYVKERIENLQDVCLPVQCWATNTKPPYPCQIRQQLVGGVLNPT